MEKTLNQLEAGFKDGKEALNTVRGDIRLAQTDLDKQKESLGRIETTQKYASDQLSYLRNTSECVSFEEYVKIKGLLSSNVELHKNISNDIARISKLVEAATATAVLIEKNLVTIKKQIKDHDNVFFLEDYNDDIDQEDC